MFVSGLLMFVFFQTISFYANVRLVASSNS